MSILEALLQPLLPILGELLAAALLALLAYLLKLIRDRFGIEIETARRDALQTAITNGAGLIVMRLGAQLGSTSITASSPAVREAIGYVQAAAPDAVAKFNLTGVDVAEKLIAKVGVLTAANPAVSPLAIAKP